MSGVYTAGGAARYCAGVHYDWQEIPAFKGTGPLSRRLARACALKQFRLLLGVDNSRYRNPFRSVELHHLFLTYGREPGRARVKQHPRQHNG